MATIKTVMALAAARNWTMYQLDISNAFLHGQLDEKVYMQMPKKFPIHKTKFKD